MACKACSMPRELKKECSCPLKESTEKKICEVKIQNTSSCTIITGEITKEEAWKRRALKELRKALNTHGSINQREIVLRGVHEPSIIIEILQKTFSTPPSFFVFYVRRLT